MRTAQANRNVVAVTENTAIMNVRLEHKRKEKQTQLRTITTPYLQSEYDVQE